MYPHSTAGIRGSLARDVELAKAAVLYADHVDLISGQAHMLQQVASLEGADFGTLTAMMLELDPATLTSMGIDPSSWTPETRAMIPTLMTALGNPALVAMLPAEAQEALAGLDAPLAEMQTVVTEMQSASGAKELQTAIDDGLLQIMSLERAGNAVASSVDAAARTPTTSAERMVQAWVDRLTALLQDPLQRLILDPDAIGLVEALVREGRVTIPPEVADRSRAAHLGAGFIGRLPAFPDAPFDELLDLRRDLTNPLARYRGAVVRMSRSLTATPLQFAVENEADSLWTELVAPAIADLDDAFTEHSLVKELGRRVRADARSLVVRGPGLLIGLQEFGHLSSAISGAAAAAGVGAQILGPGLNSRQDALATAKQGEMYYLYRINRAGEP